MSSLLDLKDGEFEERVVQAKQPVLVEFWAAWCGPCRKLAPVLGEVMEDFRHRIRLLKVDTDENVDLPQTCDVTSIPTLILYAGGDELTRFVGKQAVDALRDGLGDALNKLEENPRPTHS